MATWNDIVNMPNNTRVFNHGFDQCVALANHYHENVLGGSFVPVASAHQWWTNFENYSQLTSKYYKSADSVPGAIFISRGGIYDGVHGHIGIVLSDTATHINTLEQNAGVRYVGRYTRNMNNIYGFLVPFDNPATKKEVLEPHQRKVGANPANRRAQPTTKSELLEPQLAKDTTGNFDGWIYGEQVTDPVNSTNIWYRGINGHWFWAGSFTEISTSGLKDLNPVAPPAAQPGQRQVKTEVTNVRAQASTEAGIIGSLAANAIITPKGWVKGQSVGGIDIWYSIDGGFAWAGAFSVSSTANLKDLNPSDPAPVDPPLPTDPTGPGTDVGPGPVLGTINGWNEASAPVFGTTFDRPQGATVQVKLPGTLLEREVKPEGGFYVGREGVPNHIVLHHAVQPNLQGLLNTLSGKNNSVPTANYAVKDSEIVAMVDEADTPSTNTRWKSNTFSVTVETANDKTTTDKPSAESHESVAWIVARSALRWGMQLPLQQGVNVLGHKDVSKTATSCPGQLDVGWIVGRANEIIDNLSHEQEPPTPDFSDLGKSLDALTKSIDELSVILKTIYNI